MDEDIDIEEHDVLDNPAIKNIFPDLSVIKTEISTFIDEASASESNIHGIGTKSSEDFHLSSIDRTCHEDNAAPISRTSFETKNSSLFPSRLLNENEKLPVFVNKIILGSKPNQETRNTNDHYEINVKPFSSSVKLNDIGSYLTNSAKFCRICSILFPQSKDLIDHMEIYHKKVSKTLRQRSFKVRPGVNGKYRCEICLQYYTKTCNLYRHMRNAHKQITLTNRTSHSYEKLFSYRKRSTQINPSKSFSKINAYLRKASSTTGSTCFHCKKDFPSQKSLIEHIYEILQSSGSAVKNRLKLMESQKIIAVRTVEHPNMKNTKSASMIKTPDVDGVKNATSSRKIENNGKITNIRKLLFKCCYCAYYFTAKTFYTKHLSKKHKDSNPPNIKRVAFNPECKFCYKRYSNFSLYNIHLQQYHKDLIEKTFKIEPKICIPKVDSLIAIKTKKNKVDKIKSVQREIKYPVSKSIISHEIQNRTESGLFTQEDDNENCAYTQMLVLAAVLFRCTRCDIHFLSSKSAMNHVEHMEMLINWKCLVCQRIFKKNDEAMHNKQHTCTNEFTVYELNELQLSRVLYKCSSCAIHFNDIRYASHYETCGVTMTKSNYCKECDILIEKNLSELHEYEHKTKLLVSNDYTIINSDVLLNSTNSEKKTCKKNSTSSSFNKMYYCKVCKCFVSQVNLHDVHKDSRCAHVVKCICRDCGLVFTKNALKSHQRRHKIEKDFKLQDFIFYDLISGKRIRPPIPEYPKCKSCGVHFDSKGALFNHACDKDDFLTCPICEIKLSDTVFKLHVAFHQYCLNKRSLSTAFLECTEKPNSATKQTEDPELKSDDYMGANSGKRNRNETVTSIQKANMENFIESNSMVEVQKTTRLKEHLVLTNDTDLKLFSIVYGCASCYITVDTFDKAVEHCQDHYSNVNFDAHTKKCDICKLKYDQRYYGDHNILHNLRLKNKTFTLLKFDSFYFAVDYKYWIKHIFESVEPHTVQAILDRSIYKYEGRVKLRLIQEGLVDLVVYKCNACRVYVDPDTIISHSENSCFRQRIHPCSHCGLPFISHVSRIGHEILHKEYSDITVNSYNIVAFDREKEWKYIKNIMDARNVFVLYKCRECDGIFERFQCRDHLCNQSDLKKCSTCSLLFYSADYKFHTLKHTIVDRFKHCNMRIIFFGQCKKNTSSKRNGLPMEYDGIVSDYEFYKCTDCSLCFKKAHHIHAMRHDCTFTSNKIQCNKCKLFFEKKHINEHTKKHDTDKMYFIKENFHFISFNGKKIDVVPADSTSELCESMDQNVETTELVDDEEASPKNDESNYKKNSNKDGINLLVSVPEKKAKIYKCKCGLHFMELNNIRSHFGHCTSRISKQVCSKCGLFFTPKELFTHLLKHHGDKRNTYKLDIVEMSQERSEVIALYKCSICSINFIDIQKAKNHFKICKNSECDKRQCKQCSYYFDSALIDLHENTHHAENVADLEITLISDEIGLPEQQKSEDSAFKHLLSQAYEVSRNFKISREYLAQISKESYSNVIYKCTKCSVHFLVENTFRRHFARHETFTSAKDNCIICGLNFSRQSLDKHVYVHHEQMKLVLENFVIVTESMNNM